MSEKDPHESAHLAGVATAALPQPTLINKRNRSVLPAVRDRQTLVSTLRSLLGDLGLKRRAKALPSLGEYLAGKGTRPPEASGVRDGSNASRLESDATAAAQATASIKAESSQEGAGGT